MACMMKRVARKEIGPGGFKCPCCGPAPKDRKAFRRRSRRRLKHADRKAARSYGAEAPKPPVPPVVYEVPYGGSTVTVTERTWIPNPRRDGLGKYSWEKTIIHYKEWGVTSLKEGS